MTLRKRMSCRRRYYLRQISDRAARSRSNTSIGGLRKLHRLMDDFLLLASVLLLDDLAAGFPILPLWQKWFDVKFDKVWSHHENDKSRTPFSRLDQSLQRGNKILKLWVISSLLVQLQILKMAAILVRVILFHGQYQKSLKDFWQRNGEKWLKQVGDCSINKLIKIPMWSASHRDFINSSVICRAANQYNEY